MAKYSSPRSPQQKQTRVPSPLDPQLPLVSGKWLAWSLAGIFGGGVALVYLTMCLLFWQGQWQILFERSLPVSLLQTAGAGKIVPFDTTETGHPQLEGLFVHGAAEGPNAGRTILYLRSTGADAFARTGETVEMLQQIGIACFAFDYHGMVKGQKEHPSEVLATQDTEAAWRYLVETRHIPGESIIFYGEGLGAALAAEAAERHPEAAGVILDRPLPTALELIHADPRSHLLPVSLLAHDRFDPTAALAAAKQPKLFLVGNKDATGRRYASVAADPKLAVYLNSGVSGEPGATAIRRFLDELPNK